MARPIGPEATERMDRPAVIRSVLRYSLALGIVQIGIALLMAWRPGPPRFALSYLAAALPWTALVGAILARNVHLLYTAAGRPITRLNLATRVTLIRVLSAPLVTSLVMADMNFMAGIVFLGAAVTDWLDGFLARRMNDVTQLGRVADPSIDAVFCGLTILALFMAGHLPLWFLLIAGLRYALLLGGAASLKLYAGYFPIRATFFGRLFYFIQYSLLLAYLLFEGPQVGVWVIRILGAVQALVSLQLLMLGRNLYLEVKHDRHAA